MSLKLLNLRWNEYNRPISLELIQNVLGDVEFTKILETKLKEIVLTLLQYNDTQFMHCIAKLLGEEKINELLNKNSDLSIREPLFRLIQKDLEEKNDNKNTFDNKHISEKTKLN